MKIMHQSGIRMTALVLALACLLLAGCGSKGAGPFEGREGADLRGYEGLKNYGKEMRLADTTVAEVARLMKEKKSFAVYAGFSRCPFCNRLIPYLCDAALEHNQWIGYLDTRKDPAWKSNLDLADYDLFVELFGEWLDYDDDHIKHLYVPMIIYIKNGKVAAVQQGVVEGADDPKVPLTPAQEEALALIFKDNFALIR